jgi:hypothetical protein
MLRHNRIRKAGLTGLSIAAATAAAGAVLAALPATQGQADSASEHATVAVGPQYDTAHVYVQPGMATAFVTSWIATFGGMSTAPKATDVTPTPSETSSELVLSPVGTLSVFGYRSGIPYPFGQEPGGDLVTNFSDGVAKAVRSGADLVVSPWNDPIGKDAIVQFPGGVYLQIYWHTKPPSYPPLATVPDSRVYLAPAAADAYIRDYLAFSRGRVTVDNRHADGAEIGMPGSTYREVLISSKFGKTLVIATNGHLRYPFGRETSGYAVTNLAATLVKARAAGAQVLWGPYHDRALDTAILKFPGGYIAEVHQDSLQASKGP